VIGPSRAVVTYPARPRTPPMDAAPFATASQPEAAIFDLHQRQFVQMTTELQHCGTDVHWLKLGPERLIADIVQQRIPKDHTLAPLINSFARIADEDQKNHDKFYSGNVAPVLYANFAISAATVLFSKKIVDILVAVVFPDVSLSDASRVTSRSRNVTPANTHPYLSALQAVDTLLNRSIAAYNQPEEAIVFPNPENKRAEQVIEELNTWLQKQTKSKNKVLANFTAASSALDLWSKKQTSVSPCIAREHCAYELSSPPKDFIQRSKPLLLALATSPLMLASPSANIIGFRPSLVDTWLVGQVVLIPFALA
jgi:hypothetical protein